jgi:uncharacterized protein
MPHKCARCSSIYEDKAPQLANGCDCGSRVFLYLRADYAGDARKTIEVLEKNTVSERDLEWLDNEFKNTIKDDKVPVSLDIENVLRRDEGKFEIDIKSLMKGEPVVIKAAEGVYYIDLQYSMRVKRKGHK